MARKPMSSSQIICISLLWVILCYVLLTRVEKIDAMTIITILMSGAIIFIPIYKNVRRKGRK